MALLVKPGVTFKRFTPALIHMLNVLLQIAQEGRDLVPGMPEDLVVTSANDATHATTSRHYKDEALDIRSKSFPHRAAKDLLRMNLQARLGPKFTVLFENEGGAQEHFHCQVKRGGTYP